METTETMGKTRAMLATLKKECDVEKESFLAAICDLCHYPYSLSQEKLDERCSECTIADDFEKICRNMRTIATGQLMQIVAEEMHPEGKEKTAP